MRTVSPQVPRRIEEGLVRSEHLRIWELEGTLEITNALILNLSPFPSFLSQENYDLERLGDLLTVAQLVNSRARV